VSKGYLTLNPLKYTHPLLSIVLPIVFLLLGGIPLPGGAVYIDRSLISDRRLRSFMSGAGPAANLLFVLFLLIPYLLLSRFDLYGAQNNFWGAYAFLMFLNIFAVVINLLPIPGIDGFGILEPFLPFSWVERARGVLPYTFLILFIVLWTPNPIRFAVLWLVGALTSVLGISSLHIGYGASLFTLFR
jgi:Zn-dependent protease